MIKTILRNVTYTSSNMQNKLFAAMSLVVTEDIKQEMEIFGIQSKLMTPSTRLV